MQGAAFQVYLINQSKTIIDVDFKENKSFIRLSRSYRTKYNHRR